MKRRYWAFLAAGMLALAGCSAAVPDPGPGALAAGSWTFTDDVGATVTLPQRPARIAGLTDVVASLWNYGVKPVAAFGFTGITQDKRFAGRDLAGVVELGQSYGQINLEALAAAKPDVIVTHAYPVDTAGTLDPAKSLYGFADLAQQQAAARIAPIVAIAMRGSAVQVIDRTVALATSLGADPAAISASRGRYAEAATRLRTAAGRGLSVLVVAAYPDEGLYVAKALDDPTLRSFVDLGVRFVDPGGDKYYWGTRSWETVGSLPADVVLESQIDPMSATDLAAQPTFARTPAAAAGQVYPWVFASLDHVAQAAYMTQLAGQLEAARKVV